MLAARQREFQSELQQAKALGCINVVKDLKDQGARQYGIVSHFEFGFMPMQALEAPSMRRLLMLDRIQDPHNFGACLRSAAAFGIDALIVPQRSAAPVNQIVHQISCGGSIIVPIIQVTNLRQAMTELQDKGVWFVATDEHAKMQFSDLDLSVPTCLVMGSEGEGVKQSLKGACDYQIAIRTTQDFSTLNVSVATGVLLSQWFNAT